MLLELLEESVSLELALSFLRSVWGSLAQYSSVGLVGLTGLVGLVGLVGMTGPVGLAGLVGRFAE